MAILVSDSRNTAYNGKLSKSNGWWRVEASNLAGRNSTSLALSSTRTIAMTFANAGNLMGVAVALNIGSIFNNARDTVTMVLKESGVTRETVSLTKAQIIGNTPTNTDFRSFFTPVFEFNYPVTTAAGVWTIEISQVGTGSTNWALATSNGSAPFYVAYCDNKVTASSTNDALVIRSNVEVDTDFTAKCNALGTGDSVFGAALVLLSSQDVSSPDNICNFRWDTSVASTFTIDGIILTSADSGFRIGTAASPCSYANQANVVFIATPTLGTQRGTFELRSSNTNCGASSFIFYGEVPTERELEVASVANAGQPDVVLTTAPTTWQAGDRVWFPKTSSATVTDRSYVIDSIVGSTVTLTTNIVVQIAAGCPAMTFEGYGVRIASNTTLNIGVISQVPNNLIFKGVFADFVSTGAIRNQAGQNPIGATASTSQYLIEDSFHFTNNQSNFFASAEVPTNGIKFNRFQTFGRLMPNAPAFTYGGGSAGGPFQNSGILTIENCQVYTGAISGTFGNQFGGVGTKFNNNKFYTTGGNSTLSQTTVRLDGFVNGEFNNNYFWRQNSAVTLDNVVSPVSWSGNKFNHTAFSCYSLNSTVINVIVDNDEYEVEGSNLNTVRLIASSYSDFQIQNSLGVVTVYDINQTDITRNNDGSLRVVNDNQVANVDKVWSQNGFIFRTGTGLADTTKRLGDYSLRFESNNNLIPLTWARNIPTGNIQNKPMSVGVWVNLASANYWAAGHTMPRLTVQYDANTQTSFAEATQTTGWQFLTVSVTPATTFGQMLISFTTQTEATGADAYVYFADFTAPLPQGSVLNLGEFNLWANAFPVTPLSFASSISANDVWSADPTEFGSSTVGDSVNKIKNNTDLIPASL